MAVKEWRGEYFKKKEGAAYVRTLTRGFPAAATANVQVTLFGIIQQKSYTFSNTQTSAEAEPRELWKFPSGKYIVDKIEFVDASGVKRSWMGKRDVPVTVLIPRVMLSNLGVWTLSPSGPKGLTVGFDMRPNSYIEKTGKGESSVAAVVNGFTGTIQKVLGGKKVLEGAEQEYSTSDSIRATSSFTRQIAMYLQIDLFKHNRHSNLVATTLMPFDQKLRACYLQGLARKSDLKGTLVFQFLLSAKTGSMRQLRKSSGSIADLEMIDCLTTELNQVPIPAPENMIGELSLNFEVK